MSEKSESFARGNRILQRRLAALGAVVATLGAGSAVAQSVPAPGEAAPPARTRWSTTMGSVTLDGARFSNVRASCGMFEVLASLGAASPAVRSCPGGSVSISIAGGAVTRATAASSDPASACLANAVRAVRFGRVSCNVEFTAGR